MDVASLADLLRETAEHHGSFEAVAPPHDWWDWYAAYMDARESGSTPEEASAAAGRYMADVGHVVAPCMEVMADHEIGTPEEHQAAREELLKREKELTRAGDELARMRRELPWVPVEKDYRFETEAGDKSLAELFDGRSQLMVYHFMFGPPYEAGCPVCSSIADTLDPQVAHLKARDTTLLLASRAPLGSSSPTGSGWAGASTGSRAAAATSTAISASSTRRRS